MGAYPQPSKFEVRSNATYDALMWAMARPGLARHLPAPGQAMIVEALIDRECAVYCNTPELGDLAAKVGAALVAPEAADHLFVDELPDSRFLRRLRCGSELYPDEGATLVMNAGLDRGQAVRLTGPGVDVAIDVSISGLPADFWAMRAKIMRYPVGFELVLVEGDRVVGIPRSTAVEVI